MLSDPVADRRKATGYDADALSVISGLTVLEIKKIERGELVDPAKVVRLFAAVGVKQG